MEPHATSGVCSRRNSRAHNMKWLRFDPSQRRGLSWTPGGGADLAEPPRGTNEAGVSSRTKERKVMSKHAGKARLAGWLGVARIVGRLGLSLGFFLGGYLLIYRPRQLRWGASDEELTRAMPGDEIQPHPVF